MNDVPPLRESVELQGSGEEAVFSGAEMESMLDLCRKGVGELVALQREAILAADQAGEQDLRSLEDVFRNR